MKGCRRADRCGGCAGRGHSLLMIIFRHITSDLPPNWDPRHWYVEYHDDEYDMGFPTGFAADELATSCLP